MKIANKPKLKLSRGMGICVAIVAACVAFVPRAGAVSFTGTSSGTFVKPTGAPSTLVTTGVNTKRFTWGTGYQSPANSLEFTGTSFASIVPPEQTFSLGTLKYFNGTVLNGTEAYTVGLRLMLGFTSPEVLTKSFDFKFNLINTPNTGTATQNADSVLLTSLFPTTIFTVDGIDYTLKLGFGSVTGSGFSQINKFSVLEGKTASAHLLGTITALTPPSVPDTGSTVALMAIAIAVLGGLKQYSTSKSRLNSVGC